MGNQVDDATLETDDELDATGESQSADGVAESEGRTADEVEAIWRKRVSQKDKAHAAAEKALREQIASLQGKSSNATSSSTDGGEQVDAQITQLRQELEVERQGRLIDQRKAKYPALSKQVGQADDIFSTDEATLARLNALADDDGDDQRMRIAPTNPKRTVSAPVKAIKDMSKEELLGALKRHSDWMQQEQA